MEKTTPLTSEDKAFFGYFGVSAKILPPLRILDPRHVFIGDVTAIREGCHINAYKDLSFLLDYVDPKYRGEFKPNISLMKFLISTVAATSQYQIRNVLS